MKRWYVVTPEFTVYEHHPEGFIVDAQEVCDWIEIEAETARDAIALGVREMLKWRDSWCAMARTDQRSPYAGIRAELV